MCCPCQSCTSSQRGEGKSRGAGNPPAPDRPRACPDAVGEGPPRIFPEHRGPLAHVLLAQPPEDSEQAPVTRQLGLTRQARTQVLGHCFARPPAPVDHQGELLGNGFARHQGPQLRRPGVPAGHEGG